MPFTNLFRRRTANAGHAASSPRRRRVTLGVEALEHRTVPSTFTVLNNLDSGAGSLRQAILDANTNPGADTIVFARRIHQITLTSGELKITASLNIQGPGADELAVSGNAASRVFEVASGTVTISGLTMSDGLAGKNASPFAGAGGGILNEAGANLTLANVVLANNQAVGDPSVVIPVNPVFNLAGGAT
jgi:hypothetical protein